MRVAISAGHGSKIRGASDIIDEVDEARRVCNQVCSILFDAAVDFAGPYFDDVSTDQNSNLHRIVDWHNAQTRDLDVSVHFNAYQHTNNPMGTECLYVTQSVLADQMAAAIASAGSLINRGPKKRTDLFFLNHTEMPAILIEVCFVDSAADVEVYEENFRDICLAIAATLAGEQIVPPEPQPPDEGVLFQVSGRCSHFGGPDDTGVAPDEGLAFIYSYDQAPHLFLPTQPPGTSGLARRLDPEVFYLACRWDYSITPKAMLADDRLQALVRANGREFLAWPADWGPHESTGRVADISPGLMDALGIETDDEVEVIYPGSAVQPEPEPATVSIQITASGPVSVIINGIEISKL